MKNLARLLLVLLIALPTAAFPLASATPPNYAAISRETASALAQGQWAAVEARFDARMKTGLPEDKLSAVWKQITAQAGAFNHILGVKVSERESYHIAVATCAFTHANLDVKVVIDTTGHIAGLFFVPAATAASTAGSLPDYAAIGRDTVSAFARGQFASVESRFDATMKAALPQDKLSAVWQQITAQAGPFDHIVGVQLTQENGYHIALVSCAFARETLDAKVVLDSSSRIAGLFFVPPAAKASPAAEK